jgi:hypothetical protein
MPRFYFHLHNDMDVPDQEGSELADLIGAIAEAQTQLLEVVAELLPSRREIVLSHRVDIEDELGAVLHSVRLSDILRVRS